MSQWKTKRGVVFFDDLLSITAKAVNSESVDGQSLRDTLRNSIDAALIDEFQDTDPVQFKIFSRLFGQKPDHWLFLIGDPNNQSIAFGELILKHILNSRKTPRLKSILWTQIFVRLLPWLSP